MSNFSKAVLSVAIILTINSCRENTSPSDTASIIGRVILEGPGFAQQNPPYNGVRVKFEGTSFSAISDSNGYYSVTGVPTGTYNISFTKPGYGEARWMSVTVTGGGNAPLIWYGAGTPSLGLAPPSTQVLFQIPSVVATLASAYFKDTTFEGYVSYPPYLILRGTLMPDHSIPQLYNAMVVFVSHTSDVSNLPGHYAASYWAIADKNMYGGRWPIVQFDTITDRFAWFFPQSIDGNFKSGDSIYVATYATSSYYGTIGADYYDPLLQQWVFTAVNPTPSPVIGTVVP